MGAHPSCIVPLAEAPGAGDGLVGGKAASLGTLIQAGFRVPRGFCITTRAYEQFIDHAGLSRHVAMELGRTVLAVPGAIDAPESDGANQLIRDGATLITNSQQIIDEIEPLRLLAKGGQLPGATSEAPRIAALSGRERDLYRLIDDAPRIVDDLVTVSGLPPSAVSAVALSLELKRLIRKTPGGYVRAV